MAMTNWQVTVPEGRSGDWEVKRFTIDPIDSAFSLFQYKHRAVPPGTYTKLTHRGRVVMSDTPAEQRDHREFGRRARGRVLINGLGLGMVIPMALEKKHYGTDRWAVEHATVVEISPDVIALVAPHYQALYGDRLTIVQADALTWQPPKGERYNAVWHDIWPDICRDNLPQMHTLHRRYGRRADWQGSWARYECERGY